MSDRSIREAIEYLAGTNKEDKIYVFDANVDFVDIPTRTCTCTMIGGKSGNTLDNVRLMSSIDDGLLIIPAVDSTVTIILSNFTEPVIIGYSEVAKIVMRGGDLGGLAIIGVLLAKLNNLENAYNDFVLKYNTHTHPETGSNTGPTTSTESTTLPITTLDEIENKNITQG